MVKDVKFHSAPEFRQHIPNKKLSPEEKSWEILLYHNGEEVCGGWIKILMAWSSANGLRFCLESHKKLQCLQWTKVVEIKKVLEPIQAIKRGRSKGICLQILTRPAGIIFMECCKNKWPWPDQFPHRGRTDLSDRGKQKMGTGNLSSILTGTIPKVKNYYATCSESNKDLSINKKERCREVWVRSHGHTSSCTKGALRVGTGILKRDECGTVCKNIAQCRSSSVELWKFGAWHNRRHMEKIIFIQTSLWSQAGIENLLRLEMENGAPDFGFVEGTQTLSIINWQNLMEKATSKQTICSSRCWWLWGRQQWAFYTTSGIWRDVGNSFALGFPFFEISVRQYKWASPLQWLEDKQNGSAEGPHTMDLNS